MADTTVHSVEASDEQAIAEIVDSFNPDLAEKLRGALAKDLSATPFERWCQKRTRLRAPWIGGLLAALIPVFVTLFFFVLTVHVLPAFEARSAERVRTALVEGTPTDPVPSGPVPDREVPDAESTDTTAQAAERPNPSTRMPWVWIGALVLMGLLFVADVGALGIRQTADSADRKDVAWTNQLYTLALGKQNATLRALVAAEGEVNHEISQSVRKIDGAVDDIDRKVQKVGEGEEALVRIVQTLAPSWAFRTFDAIFEGAERIALPVLTTPDATRPEILDAIRGVLFGYLKALHRFETSAWTFGAAPTVRYAANVMVYIPHSELVDERPTLDKTLHFWERPFADLAGILDLRPQLSAAVTTAGEDSTPFVPDPALTPLALPIPVRATVLIDEVLRYRVLPGAPYAFVYQDQARNKGLYRYPNSSRLADWCRREGDFTEELRRQIEDFFAPHDGQNVRSLVAYPLSRTPIPYGEPPVEREVPLGILNLHADRIDLLGSDRSESFETATYPLKLLLIRLLRQLRKHDALGQPDRWILTSPSD